MAITVTGVGGAAQVVVKAGVKQGTKVLGKQLLRNEAEDHVRDATLRLGEEAAVQLGGVDREDARMTRLALQQGLDTKGNLGVSAGGKKRQDAPETKKSGVYQFKDKDGKIYTGQSDDVPRRIKEHEASGFKSTEEPHTVIDMPDSTKTQREIVEHKEIQKVTGGRPARMAQDVVSNQRDPIGPKRQHLLNEDGKN